VVAERLPALVAVEQGREDLRGQRRRHEERVAFERRDDHVAQLPRRRVVFGQLHVVLGARRLRAGRDAPVNPLGLREHAPTMGDLFGRQHFGDV
jgi:hypothetical protein